MADLIQSNSINALSVSAIKASLIVKHANAVDWGHADPVLLKGELGVELDTGLFKVGNGTSLYSELPYLNVTPKQFSDLCEGVLFKPTTFSANHIPVFDESGNLVDSEITIGEYTGAKPASELELGMVLSSSDDNSISVNEDGKMSLNRVSVSNLYIPEEEELIFLAGNAN